MVPAGKKAKRLSSVNHTTKTIHHHHDPDPTMMATTWATKANSNTRDLGQKSSIQYFITINKHAKKKTFLAANFHNRF